MHMLALVIALASAEAFVSPYHSQVSTKSHQVKYLKASNSDVGTDVSGLHERSTTTSTPSRTSNFTPSNFTAHTFFLSLLVSLALVFAPAEEAQAGFGPSSGATTSPIPGLVSPKVQEQDLDGKKLKQLIGSSIDERRLAEFSAQLDDVIYALKQRQDTDLSQSSSSSLVYDTQEIAKARLLQEQIQSREALLEKLEAQPYWFNYLAAFVGSVASTLVMHPVDTIKTRLQLRTGEDAGDGDEGDFEVIMDTPSSPPPTNTAVTGTTTSNKSTYYALDGQDEQSELAPSEAASTTTQLLERPVLEIDQEEGEEAEEDEQHAIAPTATHAVQVQHRSTTSTNTKNQEEKEGLFDNLYEGLTGNIIKEGPPSALYLGVYESVKYALVPKTSPELLLLVYLVAGAAGETVGSVVRAPAEALKSLVQSKAANSAWEAAQNIIENKEAQTNVFRAWSASIWRDVPFGAIQLAIFELIKAFILNNPDIDFDSSTLSSEAIIGAFAGGCGAFVTNPADVVTTRIITQSTSCDEDDGEEGECTLPLGVLGMGKKIYEEGGVGAFFNGWQARVGYWAPSISIFLTCYCSVRQAGVQNDFF